MENSVADFNDVLKSAFFENAYSPFVIMNGNMDFVDANQAALTTIKVSKESFIGKNLVDIFPYLKGSKRLASYKNVLKTGESLGFDELTFKADDREYKFMLRAFKIGDYLGISTLDVTNLINTIGQLKNAQICLKEVNVDLKRKNQELEEFSYVVAHDLRAPLTNLKSLLHMAEQADPITDEFAPIIDRMGKVTKIMCDKIRALNEVIAIKSSVNAYKEDVLFSEVLNKIKLGHSQEIINSRTIIQEDFSKCSKIIFNPMHLESIMQNLMSNSLKYRHPKRKLIIKVTTKIVKGKTQLMFKDNGLGFDQKLADNIFVMFKRMHTHVDGLGIGLYIIHSILNESGGTIKVKSEINKGTEFKIEF